MYKYRHIIAFIIAFATLFTLCACGAIKNNETVNNNLDTEKDKIEASDPVSLTAEQYVGIENLYYLNGLSDFGPIDSLVNISVYGNRYIISYIYDKDIRAAIYDFDSRSVISDKSLGFSVLADDSDEYYYYVGLVACGTDYSYIFNDGKIYFYDNELNNIYTHIGSNRTYSSAGDGYVLTYDSNEFDIIYPDGSSKNFCIDEFAYGFPCHTDKEKIIIMGYNEWSNSIYSEYNIASGTLTYSGIVDGTSYITDGWLLFSRDNECTMYDLDNLGLGLTYSLSNDESIYCIADDGFITFSTDYGENSYSLNRYLFDSGSKCDSVSLDKLGNFSDEVWICTDSIVKLDNNIVFAVSDRTSVKFLVWCSDSTAKPRGIDSIGSTDYNSKNYDNATEVMEQFNVGLYYGEDILNTTFPDYTAAVCYDTENTAEAISIITECFNKMPEGFVNEVVAGYNGFDIYLTGSIYPTGDYSINNAAAFATVLDNRQIIVIDVNYLYNLDVTFAHEFMHIIENTIIANYYMELFPEWESYNPQDFSYLYDYKDENGNTIDSWSSPEYTNNDILSYDNINNVYFVDGYSKTFPNEDRARIFENLFTCDSELPYYFDSENLHAKAEYLCKCLRDNFDSLKNYDDIWWERLL